MTRDSLPLTEFGTDKEVSEWTVGNANIEEGHTSEENRFFILHDSKGFEPGETDTYDNVEKFIKGRKNEKLLKDRLHAVW
jgi:hypothetical protein